MRDTPLLGLSQRLPPSNIQAAQAVAIYDADGALVDYGGGEPQWAGHFRGYPDQPEETITGAVVHFGKKPGA